MLRNHPTQRTCVAVPQLCWFCAQWVDDYSSGYSLGQMVHSSAIHNSLELISWLRDETILEVLERNNRCVMCQSCVAAYASLMNHCDERYIQMQDAYREEQIEEDADHDTMLTEGLSRKLHYGCWLSGRPDIGIRQRIRGQSFTALFKAGLRFEGSVTLDAEGLRRLQSTLCEDSDLREDHDACVEFTQHSGHVYRTKDPALLARIACMKAEVFDVTLL